MYVEDQDEDVEEEEEFHEVEEEKHKTSQESVGASGDHRKLSNHSPARSSKQLTPTTPAPTTPAPSTPAPAPALESLQIKSQPSDKLTPEARIENELDEEVNTTDNSNKSSENEVHAESAVVNDKLPQDQPPTAADILSKIETPESTQSTNVIRAGDDSNCNDTKTQETVSTSKAVAESIDWANIMMHSNTQDSDSLEETPSSDKGKADDVSNEEPVVIASDQDTIDGIIQDTQVKLRIDDVSDGHSELLDKTDKEGISVNVDQTEAQPNGDCNTDSDKVPETGSADVHEAETEPTKVKECEEKQDKSNEVEEKELDLDEDVKNPQYIPKKGVFYEHDDRSHDTDEKKSSPAAPRKDDDAVEVKDTSANKKATGGEKQSDNRRTNRRQRTDADRWGHDLFKNEKQKPKSKSELINAYGYDIRQERGGRNQSDNRAPRANNSNTNAERNQSSQDGQRSRQPKEARVPRQLQSSNNGSRERKTRRQNTKSNRNENQQGTPNRRDGPINRSTKVDNTKDLRETLDEKHAAQAAAAAAARRDQEGSTSNRNTRNDSRGRRRTSRDRPNVDDTRLPPPNNVMPPITTWSSEDMMKAEAFGKKSPPLHLETSDTLTLNNGSATNAQRDRPVDGWQQASQPSKPIYQDRSIRSQDENRHPQHYSRGRYQERSDDTHRPTQFIARNQYHDRSNQQHEWHRASNFSSYAKPNDYIVKTQTFENSRLSQGNANRSNNRDLREVINERRVNNQQQNFQNKVHNVEQQHHVNQRGSSQGHYQHQYAPTQHYMHPHQQQMVQNQSHMLQQGPQPQQAIMQSQQHQTQRAQQQSPRQAQAAPNHSQSQQANSHNQQTRQPPTTQPAQPVAVQSRQTAAINSGSDNSSDPIRSNTTSTSDSLNSRPIIKTDAYTGTGMPAHHQHSQPLTQHSQNHRSLGGPMTQSGSIPATSHIVPSHLGTAATQPQYYPPSGTSRDSVAAAAAMASAYHGYMAGGHPVMDTSRYHMTPQQLSDHGYIAPGQTNDVAASSVLHQQGLYNDTSAGGTMPNSAYLAQAGTSLSPTTNIPVTGSGSQPLAPVSYIQHSQYPPPPYSNPYPQPQMNQPPPQSGHAYPPYWTYI